VNLDVRSRGQIRTLIDATAVPADRGGVGRYVDGIISAFEGEIVVACQKRDADHFRHIAPTAVVAPQSPGIESTVRRLLWEQFALPRLARRLGVDVVHSPHYTLPLLSRLPRVVTFHDATFFSDPKVHTRLKRLFFTTWIRISTRLADAVIVPSRATADEVTRYVDRPRGYVVAHHGVDRSTFSPPSAQQIEQISARLGVNGGTWLAFLGTIEPRKNVPALVRAYGMICARWDDADGQVPVLVLAGSQGWEQDLSEEISRVTRGRVIRTGFLPVDELPGLLGGSLVLCYPSLGEGFGLPVLEGMSCGATVLTTARLALPEIGGDAVAYSDVTDTSIADELMRLISDQDRRHALSLAGIERAAKFTWRTSARIHQRAYSDAALRAKR
jgi:glycosyltransferase involved in cell wall biosynthesis